MPEASFLIAIVGVCGALLGVLISGIIQFWINKKTISFYEKQLSIQEKQFEAQIKIQMDQIDAKEKEIDAKEKKLKQNAQIEAKNLFYDKYLGRFSRIYNDDLAKRTAFKRLRNELAYIGHISTLERKEKRKTRQCYPHIDNNIGIIMSDIDDYVGFDNTTAKFTADVACLRSYIDEYNCALENGSTVEELDEYLREINEQVAPIQRNQEIMNWLTEKRIEINEQDSAETEYKEYIKSALES